MVALLCLFLTLFASPFKSKSRLEAENAALRHQLTVLRQKVRGRVQLTNDDRLFLIQMQHRVPYNPGTDRRQHATRPSSIVAALAAFSRTRGVLAPPHSLSRGRARSCSPAMAVSSWTIHRSQWPILAKWWMRLSQGLENADRIGPKGKQHGQRFGLIRVLVTVCRAC